MKLSTKTVIQHLGDGLNNGHYTLYSSFRKTDNFVNAAGELISLSDDESLLAANAININNFKPGRIKEIQVQSSTILLDNKPIETESSSLYHSGIDYTGLNCFEIIQQTKAFIGTYASVFPASSLLSLLTKSNTEERFASAFDKALHADLAQAFSQFTENFFSTIKSFKGKGKGLTPSGDDFIAGVFYGVHCLEKTEHIDHSKIKQLIYQIAAGENLFSNTMFSMAIKGQHFKSLKDYLCTLSHGDQAAARKAFSNLLASGHTSGADLIAGFFSLLLFKPIIFLDDGQKTHSL